MLRYLVTRRLSHRPHVENTATTTVGSNGRRNTELNFLSN